MVPEVAHILPQLIEACRRHGVSRMWLFGSATGRGDRPFTAGSDIDLLVEFGAVPPEERGLDHPLITLPEKLEAIAGRPVQLTENAEFRNPYFAESVEATRELIYDAADEKAAVGHP